MSKEDTNAAKPLSDGMYYEIEYDACPIPGVGRYVLKPQKIKEPEKDEIRDLFGQMRDIARAHRSTYDFSRFFDRRVHHDNAAIFYKQGMFMKDFTDDYADSVPFSQYFPCYQMMGYEQLRTYFTWRTKVREGTVSDTSLSYAFLYIYELLANIGVENQEAGLEKLMFFWQSFRPHNKSVDRYVLPWLKDYHIYYPLEQPFRTFIETNNLSAHYPEMAAADDNFNLFCAISKYDIRKSAFFSAENEGLITDCFYFVSDKLREICINQGIHFEASIFQPTKKMSVWTPFEKALFYPWRKQEDRQVVLSKNEIYICSQNKWTFSTVITSESGRQLIGYVMKQMESVLRKLTKYKYKLSANVSTVTHTLVGRLQEKGNTLEDIVTKAVLEFYREATKTVIQVNPGALSIIRQEALATQEKLIIAEEEEQIAPAPSPPPESEQSPISDVWEALKSSFTEIEKKALSAVLHGEVEIKRIADENGLMIEVLVDGINEKAVDYIGDSLLDEDFLLYDDYKKQVEEMIGCA